MAFTIGKPKRPPIAAFEEEDEGEDVAAGAAPPGSSATTPSQQPAAATAALINKGSTFAQQGDSAAALRCWDEALVIEPGNGRVHEMRAQVLNATDGMVFEAVQAAQQAVALCPHWPEAHITLARVQLNLGEPLLALRSYQAAAKLQPDHPDLAAEMPTAQMYAVRQQQQQPGSRAHVVDPGGGGQPAQPPPAAAAAAAETTADGPAAQEAAEQILDSMQVDGNG